ncbi:uncharacterized protein LOC135390343 [Ornithodoros turicata]|uniref:uncharacterized protein LOC135390343 n=1 Tax=Ornithodoros turicata TaxID=34597 RepID=UPI003138E460
MNLRKAPWTSYASPMPCVVELSRLSFHDEVLGATNNPVNRISERKFIIFETALDVLLSKCQKCSEKVVHVKKRCDGTLLSVETACARGHVCSWYSQPLLNRKPLGNILLSAGILFSGSNIKKTLRLLTSVGISCFSYRTFFNVQGAFLLPAIEKVWQHHQTVMLEAAQGQGLTLAGDGRADSPGHSAKYGTYTMLDAARMQVLHIETVQSNEVANSHAMELEGLKRALQFLRNQGMVVHRLITDRHVQIQCYMRKENPDIEHLYDVWHVAKGIKKKLTAASKLKAAKDLGDWVKAIINHLYWCAMSSRDDPRQILPKWTSLPRHIANIHQHDDPLFPQCAHGEMRRTKWLPQDSSAYTKLKEIVLAKNLLKDLPQLSTVEQTYAVECFHSTLNHFAPKSTHFTYACMKAR